MIGRMMSGIVLALLASAPALAKAPNIWVQCDGYTKSQKGGGGSAGLGGLLLGRLASSKLAFQPGGQVDGLNGVNACDEALKSPELDALDWTRRTSLLKARAIHNLEALRYTEALADVEAARATSLGKDPSLFYARSTGLALDLLQSYTLLLLGKDADAARYARQAAQARPYSAQIQSLALFIMSFDTASASDAITLADNVSRFDPEAGDIRLSILMKARRFAEAADLHVPDFGAKSDWISGSPDIVDIVQLSRANSAAFAMARAKRTEESAAIMRAARNRIDKADKIKLGNTPPLPLSVINPDVAATRAKMANIIGEWEPMVSAAGLLAEGDAIKAQDALIAKDAYPANDLFLGLVDDLRAAIPAEKRKALVAADPVALREKISGNRADRLKRITNNDLFNLLPQAEDAEKLNGFSSQAGFGLKSTGFKSKLQADGTTQIEFVGTVSSPQAIAEMVLLRAATLAQDAQKSGFVIEKSNSYTRYIQSTYGGTPIGNRRFAGYKSELFVRFVDDVATPRAITNDEVVKALKPIYVRANSNK
jgi:hypothetical protein